MKNPYTDLDYASGRLYGTIVRLDDDPVYVSNTMGDIYEVKYLDDGHCEEVPYSDLDLNPYDVGNLVLDHGSMIYCIRYPARQWKQGLRVSQIMNAPQYDVNLFGKNFLNMLKGTYGSLEERFDILLNGEAERTPLTKHFSMRFSGKDDLDLVFKQTKVGTITPSLNNLIPKLLPRYSFLTELFEDTMNKQKGLTQ